MSTPASILLAKGASTRNKPSPGSVSFRTPNSNNNNITHFSDVDVLDEPEPAAIKKLAALDVAPATARVMLSDPSFASGLTIMTNQGKLLFLAAPHIALMDNDTKEVLVCNLDDQVGSKHPVAIDVADITKGTILLLPAAFVKKYSIPAGRDSTADLDMVTPVPDTSLVDQIEWPYKDKADAPTVAYVCIIWPTANKGSLEHNKPAPTLATNILSKDQTFAEVMTTCLGWLHHQNDGKGLHHADTKIFKSEDIDMNIFDGATIVDNIYTKLLLLDPINDSDILLSHQRKMD
jgi:hypothetical protein